MLGSYLLGEHIQAEIRKAKREEAARYRLLHKASGSRRTGAQRLVRAIGSGLVSLGSALLVMSNSSPPSLRYS